jgi:hypothetical protein
LLQAIRIALAGSRELNYLFCDHPCDEVFSGNEAKELAHVSKDSDQLWQPIQDPNLPVREGGKLAR